MLCLLQWCFRYRDFVCRRYVFLKVWRKRQKRSYEAYPVRSHDTLQMTDMASAILQDPRPRKNISSRQPRTSSRLSVGRERPRLCQPSNHRFPFFVSFLVVTGERLLPYNIRNWGHFLLLSLGFPSLLPPPPTRPSFSQFFPLLNPPRRPRFSRRLERARRNLSAWPVSAGTAVNADLSQLYSRQREKGGGERERAYSLLGVIYSSRLRP